ISSKIDRSRGAIAFVDGYTTWITGPSAAENTDVLQRTAVAKVEQWTRRSGAVFEADKTVFVHFTR
ncbi:hypothetical protein EJ05DRAFT_424701, partial [Pseudovirgaria hyperparasitica]